MPSAKNATSRAPHVTKGDVFQDLGLSRAEMLEARIKAEIWRELVTHIENLHMKQKDLAARLDVYQPDVSNLLAGKISKFSVGTLIQYAVKLDLDVHVRLTAPKASAKQKMQELKSIDAKAAKPRRKRAELSLA